MNEINQEDTHRTIERVARESYGRLVAYLSSRTRDVAGAEDALGNALVAALAHWPQDGVPQNPEAWLLTAARRSLIDVIRHQQVVLASEPTLQFLKESPRRPLCRPSSQMSGSNCSSSARTRRSTRRCTHPLCCRRHWV